jgi:hypothetical protein
MIGVALRGAVNFARMCGIGADKARESDEDRNAAV